MTPRRAPISRYDWRGRLVPVLLVLFILTVPGWAELPLARLTAVWPPGARVGTSVSVTVTGQDLDALTGLRFSDPRITARPAGAPGVFAVTVAPEVRPGAYDVRAVGRYGITNPRAFTVGTLEEVVAKAGNTSIEAAAPVGCGTTVSAVAEANAAQYFRLSLKDAQHVVVAAEARTIDSRMEPVVVIGDAAGREWAVNRRGGPIDFTAPYDGDYVIKVHDVTYRGGPAFFYRMTVREGALIDSVEPAAGVPGTVAHLWIAGRHFPDGAARVPVKLTLPLDPAGADGPFDYVPSSSAFLDAVDFRYLGANAVRIGFAAAPPIVANDETARGQTVEVPYDVTGRFRARGGASPFAFDAPAGVWWIEVISHRVGQATAPTVLVQRVTTDDKGVEKIADVAEAYESPANLGGREFPTNSRDPSQRLEVKEAGRYRVTLRDLFTTGGADARPTYRLVIRRESPDFRLVAFPAPPIPEKDSRDVPVWTPLVRRGGVTPVKVVVERRDNFAGAIQLNAQGLPPGVTCATTTIGPGATSAVLLMSASAGAEAAVGPILISGTAVIDGAAVTRVARAGTVATSSYDAATKTVELSSRRARELMVAVSTELSPLSIAPAREGAVEAVAGTKVALPFRVVRRATFIEPIPLRLAGHPALAPLKEISVPPTTDAATLELDLAQVKLAPGEYDLHAETLAKLRYVAPGAAATAAKDVTASFYSAPVRLVVTPPAPATVPTTAPTVAPKSQPK